MKAMVEVRVASLLRELVRGASTVQAQGETVRQLLEDLDSQFPGSKERMINERGKLNGHIIVYLNKEDIRSLEELETPLKDGDVVSILEALSGG